MGYDKVLFYLKVNLFLPLQRTGIFASNKLNMVNLKKQTLAIVCTRRRHKVDGGRAMGQPARRGTPTARGAAYHNLKFGFRRNRQPQVQLADGHDALILFRL